MEREAAALTLLEQWGFAAPRLLAADPRGERYGVPALLMTCLPGRPPGRTIAPAPRALEQLAAAALGLHRIPGPWSGIPGYRPYHDLRAPRPPVRSTRPELWERAFIVVAGAPPLDREVFIHRDYHPGNALWLRGQLTGVVDWSTASVGPAGVDLGHMRWNLVFRHGEQHARAFLESYCASHGEGYEHHPYWDLRTLVDLLPDDDPAGAALDRLEGYLARLLAQF